MAPIVPRRSAHLTVGPYRSFILRPLLAGRSAIWSILQCKQAESGFGVPGVYSPDMLRLGDGKLTRRCEYCPEGALGPP
jgi:hypothetical protein